MALSLGTPSRAGSIGRSARGLISAVVPVLVVLLVVLGGLAILVTVPHLPGSSSSPSGAAPAAGPPTTHGDLNVTSGETFIIQPTPGTHVYYQGGNITVFSGGTLIIRNVTLTFVQFVSDIGTPIQRVSHIYRFVDRAGGTVNIYNSTVTTDMALINAWAKLNVTVKGAMTVWNSTFAFPGWVNVQGAAGDLTFNDSKVTANPQVATANEPAVILGDTDFAPSISVTDGAQLNAYDSSFANTYADNTDSFGQPSTVPLGISNVAITPGTDTFGQLFTPTDSANLTQNYLYPNATFGAGTVTVNWVNHNATVNGTANLYLQYNGTDYFLESLLFFKDGSGTFYVSIPTSTLNIITADGVLNYLNWTGDFGVTPSKIGFEFEAVAGAGVVNITSMYMTLLPNPQYNIVVKGVGSTLNSIDTAFGLTWFATPSSPTSIQVPYPWNSNKLLVLSGAKAFLANATVTSAIPGVFSYSAVLPDASSAAYFYRWAQFNLTGRGGVIPVVNAQVSAFYAYTTNQTNNQTANALNDLATANPQIWGYVHYWDVRHGVKGYGMSNATGVATILLASSNLTAATLPDGFFLGTYHVGIVVPATGVTSHWFNWSVSPYPEGVAQTPPALAGPDLAPSQQFNAYFGGMAIFGVTVSANGVPATSINYGQVLGVHIVMEDLGAVPITNVAGEFKWNSTSFPKALLASYKNTTLYLNAPGQEVAFNLDWVATENYTGVNTLLEHNFTLITEWNNNSLKLGGGNLSENLSMTFLPTMVTVTSTVLANGVANDTVSLGQTLGVKVVVADVANATITQVAANLYYNSTKLLATFEASNLHLNAPGDQVNFTLKWKSTENVTGLLGWFHHNLSLAVFWNGNSQWLGAGNLADNVSLTFSPSQIRFVTFSTPSSPLNLGYSYISTGTLEFNGSHSAVIELTATAVGTTNSIVIAGGSAFAGVFELPWSSSLSTLLTPGTTYVLKATATYNQRVAYYNLTGTYSVPPTPSSTSNFFSQTFLGIPVWLWIVIAAIAVVAIVLFLFFARRQAAGKLVECGECGNLIPEDATVCPKCGAEFESDLIRCSRCASTIPADSKFCPECAAQLLGTPGEAAADPEKQAYADFTEKYRAEAKRELGDNYSEGAFWDWWKRQPSYTPFSQWSLQQGQGTPRAGMTAPPAGKETTEEAMPPSGKAPPKGGTGWTEGGAGAGAPAPTPTPTVPPPAAGAGTLKACPSCGKEIPSEYLVCPFCNAVTQ